MKGNDYSLPVVASPAHSKKELWTKYRSWQGRRRMANPQPNDAHIRIAHSITEAVMMRDFTKRQRKILDLILRLSWGCGKKEAHIPRQYDFTIVGIGEGHIKQEIEWLIASGVIQRENDSYWFNKDFDNWQVSRVKPFVPQKLTELVSLNLKQNNGNLTETVTPKLPKQELSSYRNSNIATSDLASAKEILKKDINSSSNIYKTYESNIGLLTPIISEELKDLENTFPEDWIMEAIEIAVKAQKGNLRYIEGILKSWATNGKDVKFKKGEDPDKYIKGKYGHMVKR